MNQRTQAPAERAVWDTLAAEAAGKAVSPPFTRMVRLLMHDWPTLLAMRTVRTKPPRQITQGREEDSDSTWNSQSGQRVQSIAEES